MNLINRKVAVLIFSFLFLAGCFTISNIYPPGDFKIVVLSDIHITNSESKDKRLSDFIKDINNNKYPGVELLITCGDNVSSIYDSYTPDSSYKGFNRLERFMQIIKQSKIPFYLTIGNHEYKIEKARDSDAPYAKDELLKMEQLWQKITGFKPYYSIVYKDWKLIFLNSMGARDKEHYFDKEQLNWLDAELDSPLPVLLFFHHPLKTDNFRIWDSPLHISGEAQEPRFYEIINSHKDNIKGIFVGHGHLWGHDTLFEKIKVYETASFGDDESNPHIIIGIDSKAQKISVARSPVQIREDI